MWFDHKGHAVTKTLTSSVEVLLPLSFSAGWLCSLPRGNKVVASSLQSHEPPCSHAEENRFFLKKSTVTQKADLSFGFIILG